MDAPDPLNLTSLSTPTKICMQVHKNIPCLLMVLLPPSRQGIKRVISKSDGNLASQAQKTRLKCAQYPIIFAYRSFSSRNLIQAPRPQPAVFGLHLSTRLIGKGVAKNKQYFPNLLLDTWMLMTWNRKRNRLKKRKDTCQDLRNHRIPSFITNDKRRLFRVF